MTRPETPIEVIRAAQSGESWAWERLCDDWYEVILWRCRVLGCGRAEPEDVASEVFLTLRRALPKLRDPTVFPAFCLTTVRNVVRDQRRRAWFRLWAGSPESLSQENFAANEPVFEGASPEEDAHALLVRDLVGRALSDLPEKYRAVLMLCDGEGYTPTEAAALLELSVNTVKTRRDAGRKRLKKAARRRGLGEEDV